MEELLPCQNIWQRNVWNIIVKAPLRFGRSRTAQYAACSIAGVPKISSCAMEEIIAETGEPIYVVLQSDLILSDSGVFAMGQCFCS